MSDFLDLLRCFDGTSLKTKGNQKMLPVSKVIEGVEKLEMEKREAAEIAHGLAHAESLPADARRRGYEILAKLKGEKA